MGFSVEGDFFIQLVSVSGGCHRNLLLDFAMNVGVGLDVRSVNIHCFRRETSCTAGFIQNPLKYLFNGIRRKAMTEVVAYRRKMGKLIAKGISKKPAVCNVDFDFRHRPSQRWNTEQMLYHDDFEQHYRFCAWAAIILTVQFFHKIIDMDEIYCSIYPLEQMVSGHQSFHAQYFDYPSAQFLLLIQHLFTLLSSLFFYFNIYMQKAQLSLDFFDSLRNG